MVIHGRAGRPRRDLGGHVRVGISLSCPVLLPRVTCGLQMRAASQVASHTLTLDLPSCLSPERRPSPWWGRGGEHHPGGSTRKSQGCRQPWVPLGKVGLLGRGRQTQPVALTLPLGLCPTFTRSPPVTLLRRGRVLGCKIFFFFFFVFLGPYVQHMEVSRLGVKSEL